MYSKLRAFAPVETKIFGQVTSNFPFDAYADYIRYERNAKRPDVLVMSAVYERAIAEAAKRRFASEVGAEEALRVFWVGYIDAMVSFLSCRGLSCLIMSFQSEYMGQVRTLSLLFCKERLAVCLDAEKFGLDTFGTWYVW